MRSTGTRRLQRWTRGDRNWPPVRLNRKCYVRHTVRQSAETIGFVEGDTCVNGIRSGLLSSGLYCGQDFSVFCLIGMSFSSV